MISTYLSIAKDALIVAAIAFLGWWVYHSGGNSVKVADMQAVTKQLAQNDKTVQGWKAQQDAAEVIREKEMADLRARIDAQRAPIYVVRQPPNPGPVPRPTFASQGANPQGGGADTGSRGGPQPIDIRAAVNAFETKYESALSDCRAALSSWPK